MIGSCWIPTASSQPPIDAEVDAPVGAQHPVELCKPAPRRQVIVPAIKNKISQLTSFDLLQMHVFASHIPPPTPPDSTPLNPSQPHPTLVSLVKLKTGSETLRIYIIQSRSRRFSARCCFGFRSDGNLGRKHCSQRRIRQERGREAYRPVRKPRGNASVGFLPSRRFASTCFIALSSKGS